MSVPGHWSSLPEAACSVRTLTLLHGTLPPGFQVRSWAPAHAHIRSSSVSRRTCHGGVGDTKGDIARAMDAFEYAFNQATATNLRRSTDSLPGRPDHRVTLLTQDVKARLRPGFHQTLTFQFQVSLLDGGKAEVQAIAQLPERRELVSGSQGPEVDLICHQLRNLLI